MPKQRKRKCLKHGVVLDLNSVRWRTVSSKAVGIVELNLIRGKVDCFLPSDCIVTLVSSEFNFHESARLKGRVKIC